MSDISADELAISVPVDAAAPKKGKLLPMIAAVGVLTLVAIGAGAGVGLLLGGKTAPEAPAAAPAPAGGGEAAPAAEGEAAAGQDKVPNLVIKLEPVVTNIAAPPTTLLRIEASLVIRPGEVDDPEVLAAQIKGDTLTFMRTLDLAQVEGARGLLHLREDLRERAQLRSPAVVDYLIQSLVAQ